MRQVGAAATAAPARRSNCRRCSGISGAASGCSVILPGHDDPATPRAYRARIGPKSAVLKPPKMPWKLAAALSRHATTFLARFRQANGDGLPAAFYLASPAASAAARAAAFVAVHLTPHLVTGPAGISAFPSLGHAISSNSFVSQRTCAPPNNRCRCNKLLSRSSEQSSIVIRLRIEPRHPAFEPSFSRRVALQHQGIVARHDVPRRRRKTL